MTEEDKQITDLGRKLLLRHLQHQWENPPPQRQEGHALLPSSRDRLTPFLAVFTAKGMGIAFGLYLGYITWGLR